MCQVVPFILPCCGRTYVEVSRLPSCPTEWPKQKCPAELCIQLRGIDAEKRPTGECWRCKARAAGKSGYEREKLRPDIDRAEIVAGLEEPGVNGRRRIVEESGRCWFCNARGGCKECGAQEVKVREEQTSHLDREETPNKKKHKDSRPDKDRRTPKRAKVDKSEVQPSTPNSKYSTPRLSMSNPDYSPLAPLTPGPGYPNPTAPANSQPYYSSAFGSVSFDLPSPFENQSPAVPNIYPTNYIPSNPHAMLMHTPQTWNAVNIDHGCQNLQDMSCNVYAEQHQDTSLAWSAAASELPMVESRLDPSLYQSNPKSEPGAYYETTSPVQNGWSGQLHFDQNNFDQNYDAGLVHLLRPYEQEPTDRERQIVQESPQQPTFVNPKSFLQ